MKQFLFLLLFMVGMACSVRAQTDFRWHRTRHFNTLPITSGNTVFIGNSITQGNEWWEAFGDTLVKDRGIWGARAYEVLNNFQAYITGKPKRVFIMIGTNDLSEHRNSDRVFGVIRTMVERIRKESPNTEIYLQSILPTQNYPIQLQTETNAKLRSLAEQTDRCTYIDLWNLFINANGTDIKPEYSNDHLHLFGQGYKVWTERIRQLFPDLGLIPQYGTAEHRTPFSGGSSAFYNQRYTLSTLLPVTGEDVVFLGDMTINSANWKELFPNLRALNRGIGTGYPGANIAETKTMLESLQGKTAPAAIVIATGQAETNSNNHTEETITESIARYKTLVEQARTYFPTTKIYVLSAIPTNTASINTNKIEALFNPKLQAMVGALNTPDIQYVDVYTPLLDASAKVGKTGYFSGNFIQGLGYARLAETLAAAMNTQSLTEAQATGMKNLYDKRNALMLAVIDAQKTLDAGVEHFEATAFNELQALVNQADAVLITKGAGSDATLPTQITQKLAQVRATDTRVPAGLKLSTSVQEPEHLYYIQHNTQKQYYLRPTTANGTVQKGRFALYRGAAAGTYKIYSYDAQKWVHCTDPTHEGRNKISLIDNKEEALSWVIRAESDNGTSVDVLTDAASDKSWNYHGGFSVQHTSMGLYASGDSYSSWSFVSTTPSVTVSKNTGTFTQGNVNWASIWQASGGPAVTLSVDNGKNNMNKNSTNIHAIELWRGADNTCSYTLSAPQGFEIVSYSFKFKNVDSSFNATFTPTGKAGATAVGTAEAALSVTDINARTAQFTLSINGNKGAQLYEFVVSLRNAPIEPLPEGTILPFADGADIPYRIPAIAATKSGKLITVADYRFSRADIGVNPWAPSKTKRIDLHYRISPDNGRTWGEIKTLVQGDGLVPNAAYLNTGYGDPCIVADRESQRVLVLAVAGNRGFGAGSRYDNPSHGVRFYSENDGETWTAPQDITEQIYQLFDNSQIGPINSYFVGSGKIHQSRYYKVGAYYRLYACLLVKDKNSAKQNFAIYSDDFGGSWHVLGTIDTPHATTNEADEPKIEELPDGSVILSSRRQNTGDGGRIFNIFRYTNVATGQGEWQTQALSTASNNGCRALNNACNGEILVVPVKRKSDQKKMFLALQSIPLGSGRANVGIYYKALDAENKFDTPVNFAKNWDGSHQVSTKPSAYSTMVWQTDNTLGFVWEEDVYGIVSGGGYSILYRNLSIEQITNNAYEYTDEEVDMGFELSINSTIGYSTFFTHQAFKMPQGVEGLTLQQPNNNGKLGTTVAYAAGELVPPGTPLLLRGTSAKAIYAQGTVKNTTGENLLQGTLTTKDLTATEGHRLYILNRNAEGTPGFYWAKGTQGNSARVLPNRCYLNLPYTATSPVQGYLLTESPTTKIGSTTLDRRTDQTYDLSGRKEKSPHRGIYIVNGKKVVR